MEGPVGTQKIKWFSFPSDPTHIATVPVKDTVTIPKACHPYLIYVKN